jgi:ABC transporter, phosphonate, periplasmic substrate-binding protein
MTADRSGAPLRFATFLAPNMLPVYRFLADQIAHRLGRPVQLVVGSSFDQFEHGEADLGVICGLPYVWLADRRPSPVEPLAGPVLTGERYAGRPIYYSDVIVHRDSPITRIQELQGRSWAYNEPASHSGHSLTLHALVRMGARPSFFARIVEAGVHRVSSRASWRSAIGTTTTSGPCSPPSTPLATPPSASKPGCRGWRVTGLLLVLTAFSTSSRMGPPHDSILAGRSCRKATGRR